LTGNGEINQDHALAGLLFGHHGVDELADRGIDLGDEWQALEDSLEEVECLATNDERGNAPDPVKDNQG
jgi:hypothetical protein